MILISIREAARRAGAHAQTVGKWCRVDGLPHFTVYGTNRKLIAPTIFDAWLVDHPKVVKRLSYGIRHPATRSPTTPTTGAKQ